MNRRTGVPHPILPPRLRAYPGWVAASVARWAFLKAIRPLASWSRARWFSSFLDQRMRMPRLRFSQEWVASTTQRRARQPGVRDLVGDLLAARADVRRDAVLDSEIADRRCCRSLGPGTGPAGARRSAWGRSIGIESSVPFSSLWSLRLAPSCASPIGTPAASRENRALRPLLALSVGFGPVFGPPSGALVIAPSAASHDQSIPTTSSYSKQPLAPDLVEHTGLLPLLKAPVRRELEEQTPVAFSAFHCIPVRSTSKIASIASRSGTRGA